jgi:hypothetical protein
VFLFLALLVTTAIPVLAAPPDQTGITCEDDYIVQPGDWLSKIADLYYGDVFLYPGIVMATNEAAKTDDSYAVIGDFDTIEVGWKLCIPSPDDAETLTRMWEQASAVSWKQTQVWQSKVPPREPYPFDEGEHYIKDEVILTGPYPLLEDVATSEGLTRLGDPISFEALGRPPFIAPLRFDPDDFQSLAIGLYQIPAGRTVTETIQDVYDRGLDVYADPNYLTRRAISSRGWDPGGSPLTITGTAVLTEPKSIYYGQWALGPPPGINLFDSVGNRPVDDCGTDTLVAIFDTSPFTGTGEFEFKGSKWPDKPCGSFSPTLKLRVFHPIVTDTLISPGIFANVNDHGLFVAGLVHAVAPDSKKHLIRVLNQNGHGTLFELVDALYSFIEFTLENQPIEDQVYLEKTVINLSLGVDANSTETPVVALETPLAIADGYGATIVAAAGNASGQPPDYPVKPSELPAGYSFVIGVASSNQQPARSCFSNQVASSSSFNEGNVAAPGGEGAPGSLPDGTYSNCTPQLNQCSDEGCEYAVVSLALSSVTGYQWWAGTSFATPLVSGQAALLHSQVPYTQVTGVITNTAVSIDPALGDGVVDISASLTYTP